MTASADEKRRQTRYSYGLSITYMGKVGTTGSPPMEVAFGGKIVDLSNGGIGIETKGHAFVEVGMLVRTWIPLISVSVEVPVLTRVQWIRDNHAGESQLVGLMFVP